MIRLGIIGAGIMGERLLRAALDHAADTVEIAGIFDPAPAAMRRIADALPQVAQSESAKALIEASECVYIASPPASHLRHARTALARGRAVFCEKPLATDLDDARRFVEQTEGLRVAVNFPFASSFAVERLRAWLAEGLIGAPRDLSIRLDFATWPRPWQTGAAGWLDRREEGGFAREVLSHFLFLSRRLIGPLRLEKHAVFFPEDGRSERALRAFMRVGDLPCMVGATVGGTREDDENSWQLTGVGAVRLRNWSIAERREVGGAWVADPDALPNEVMRPLVLKRQLAAMAAMTRGKPHALATVAEAFEVQTVIETMLRPVEAETEPLSAAG